jgi:K+/H+ antiporter YhaU regulatory subunit KhtT
LLGTLRSAAANLSLQWYQLSSNSRYVDQPIGRLDIRQRTGASIVAIVRGTEILVNPDATTFLRAGDRLAALGDDAQRQRFVAWLRAGEQDEVAEEQLLLPEVQMPYSSVD